MSIDDLYNNFKIDELEVKGSVSSSSTIRSQNMAFVSTPGSTNEDTAHIPVSTAGTPISAASTSDSAASLSDATVYAFLANQPYRSEIVHEYLEQIHDDDLEEMDLKWQLALLSMRAKKFYQRNGKKITINGGDTARFDKTKVECFNCHKLGYFARECRNPRGQDGRARSYDQGSKNQEITKRIVKVEEASPKAMLAVDGAGFDWSFMAEEEVPTNMALMAFSDSEVQKDKTCSSICLKSFETLKAQYDKLRIDCNKTEFDLANYKRALASVEEQLAFYKQNEVTFTDKIVVLKRDATFNETEIIKTIIEKLKKEKEDNLLKINNYDNATKSLDKVIGSQLIDNNKKGLGYNVVPPPLTGLFVPPSIDLSHSGIEKFKEPEFVGYGVKVDKIVSENSSVETKKTSDAPIIKDWVSDCEEDEIVSKVVKFVNVQQKPKQANEPRNASQIPKSLNHQIKDCDYHDKKMGQKPVLNKGKKGTGERESKPVWNDAMRTNHQNFSNNRRNFSPKAVLTKSGKVPISTARQSSPRAAVPISTAKPVNTAAPKSLVNVAKYRTNVFQKRHSPTRRPVHQETTLKNRNLKNKVNNVKTNYVNTVKTKRVTSAVGKKGVNYVKPSACWVWRPKIKVIDHAVSNGGKILAKVPLDQKNSVLFTETECLILSPDFKLPDEINYVLRFLYMDNICSWVFFLAKKDETSGILRNFITGIENQLNHRVKIIRSDNGTEFKNQDLNQFCNSKGIKREYNNARTPQQNRVAKRKNRTLIEVARTMLADSLLPIPFWAEAVNTACYVQNRVLVTKPHNKIPYELLIGRPPIISFMRPFGCPVTILNTLDHLGKFVGKADERVLVGYSIISTGNRANVNAGIETNSNAGHAEKEKVPDQEYILLPLLHTSSYGPSTSEEDVSSLNDDDTGKKVEQELANVEDHTLKDAINNMLNQEKMATKHSDDARSQFEEECDAQLFKGMRIRTSSINSFNIVRTPLNTTSTLRTSYPTGTSSEP
ncbi:ribonuclease H-like domain-containing protein [Tanacetum coccineum]